MAMSYILSVLEAHWFDRRRDDNYVYHGTSTKNFDSIKRHGLTSLWSNWFAADPRTSMQYGYRPSIHHYSDSKKLSGAVLRVHKKHVSPEGYERRANSDFWKTGEDIPPEHIEIHQGGGKWKPLLDTRD